MEDRVFKVCNQLISNTHVIGIIIDCKNFPNTTPEQIIRDKVINFCVISKEAGHQKTMYMDNDFLINIHWHRQEEFVEAIKQSGNNLSEKTILFDRTGFLRQLLNENSTMGTYQ